jgi:hypothetical protein
MKGGGNGGAASVTRKTVRARLMKPRFSAAAFALSSPGRNSHAQPAQAVSPWKHRR